MSPSQIFLSVFGVIFIAELPDKTAVAALVLATRNKALPVFLGTALALTVQSLVAVAAGGLLTKLPARPVHIASGLLFVVSAVVMWLRKDDDDDDDDDNETATDDHRSPHYPPTFLRTFGKVFGVVFIAEWGDLTQLGTAALAARYNSPFIVFSAATLALWLVAAIAVFIGNRAGKVLKPEVMKKVAAGVFAVLGVALIVGVL